MGKNLFTLGLATLVAFSMSGYVAAQDDPFGSQVSHENTDPFGQGFSVHQQEDSTPSKSTSKRSPDEMIRDALDSKIDFDYDETPFIEIMDQLQEVYGINVMLDQSASDDSLSEDDLVTFKVRKIRMKAGLRLMLDQFNATYLVKNEVLLIISKDVANDPEFFTRRIINCRSLIETIGASDRRGKDAISAIYQIGEKTALGGLGNGGATTGGGVFSLVPGDEINGLVDDKGQINMEEQAKTWFLVQRGFDPGMDLIDTVKLSIAPDDWDDTNGDGSITLVGGCLVIQQTEEVIEDIEDLLVELTKSMGQ